MKRFTIFIALACGGCEVTRHYHGQSVKDSLVELQAGKTTKDDVVRIIGTPTCVLFFDPNTWYYLSQINELKATALPNVCSVACYAITFNQAGVIKRIVCSTEGFPISINSSSTPLPSQHGNRFLEQLFRNTGKFPPAAGKPPSSL